jgi:predicted RNA-binding protein with PIN domain
MIDEHIIIDGYNAIFRDPALRDLARQDLERGRNELVRRVAEAFRGRRERITIVFDGNRAAVPGGRNRLGSVRIAFSIPPETADDKIQRLVEEARRVVQGRRRLSFRIVSSDREVAARAKLWGARTVGSQDFLNEVETRRTQAAEARLAGEQAEFRRKTGLRPPLAAPGPTRGAGGGVGGGVGTGGHPPAPSARPSSQGRGDHSGGGPGGPDRAADPAERERKPHLPGKAEVDEWERLFRERGDAGDDEEE